MLFLAASRRRGLFDLVSDAFNANRRFGAHAEQRAAGISRRQDVCRRAALCLINYTGRIITPRDDEPVIQAVAAREVTRRQPWNHLVADKSSIQGNDDM